MPKIPTIFANAQDQLSVAPMGQAARARAGALDTAGEGVGKLADAYNHHEQMLDAVDSNETLTKATVEATNDLQTRIAKADPNDPTVIPKWREEWATKLSSSGDNLRSDLGRKNYQLESTKTLASIEMEGIHQQVHLAGEKAASTLDSGSDVLANQAHEHPEMVGTFAARAASNVAAINAANPRAMPTGMVDGEVTKATQKVFDMGGDGLLRQYESNPDITPDQVNALKAQLSDDDNQFKKGMSPPAYKSMMDRVDKLGNTQSGIMADLAEKQFGNTLDVIRDGNEPSIQDAENYIDTVEKSSKNTQTGVVKGFGMRRQLASAIEEGQAAKSVKELPDVDVTQRLASAQDAVRNAKTDEDRIKALADVAGIEKAQKRRDAQFKASPADYAVNNNDAVASRASAFDKEPTPANWSAYANASSAYQRQLYPGKVPQLVTPRMRDSIGASMQQLASDPKATDQAAATLVKWANTTGSNWIQVAHELYGKGTLNEDQFVASTLYQKPQAKVLADTLLRASAMSSSQRQALGGVSYDSARSAAIAALQPLRQSLGNTGEDGAALMEANINVLSHIMQVQGTAGDDLDSKASDLADAVVNDEFDFRGRNGSTTLRIPKVDRNGKPTGLDPDEVHDGTVRELSNIGSRNLVVPKSLSGLSDSDQRKNYVDRIQHDGAWYTTGDGTGAELRDIDGGGQVKEIVNGKVVPVVRKWDELTAQSHPPMGIPSMMPIGSE